MLGRVLRLLGVLRGLLVLGRLLVSLLPGLLVWLPVSLLLRLLRVLGLPVLRGLLPLGAGLLLLLGLVPLDQDELALFRGRLDGGLLRRSVRNGYGRTLRCIDDDALRRRCRRPVGRRCRLGGPNRLRLDRLSLVRGLLRPGLGCCGSGRNRRAALGAESGAVGHGGAAVGTECHGWVLFCFGAVPADEIEDEIEILPGHIDLVALEQFVDLDELQGTAGLDPPDIREIGCEGGA